MCSCVIFVLRGFWMSTFSHDASGKYCTCEATVGGAQYCEVGELAKLTSNINVNGKGKFPGWLAVGAMDISVPLFHWAPLVNGNVQTVHLLSLRKPFLALKRVGCPFATGWIERVFWSFDQSKFRSRTFRTVSEHLPLDHGASVTKVIKKSFTSAVSIYLI